MKKGEKEWGLIDYRYIFYPIIVWFSYITYLLGKICLEATKECTLCKLPIICHQFSILLITTLIFTGYTMYLRFLR